jgi:hypothetical protein
MSSGRSGGAGSSADVQSPCIGVCMMNDALGHCLGCGRTRNEIGRWPWLGADERREVIRLAQSRSGLAPAGEDKASKP